jgi:predicted RecA/RadA family phage recombinase
MAQESPAHAHEAAHPGAHAGVAPLAAAAPGTVSTFYYVNEGDVLVLPAPRNVNAGDGVWVGKIFGMSRAAVSAGQPMPLIVEGAFRFPRPAAEAWATAGVAVYFDETNQVATVAVKGVGPIGVIVETGIAGGLPCLVKLYPPAIP